MIIKDTDTIKDYISVNGSFTYKNVESYLKKAQRRFLKSNIGAAQLAVFEDDNLSDETKIEARELAREVVANFGYYLYLPIGAVQISNNGINVAANEHTNPASDKQFKELQRSFKTAGHEALDELLEFMEESPDKFTEWTGSPQFTEFKELLVYKATLFNKYYHIFNSRQTFIAMRPTIKIVEDQFISPVVGFELLDALKADQTGESRKEAKALLQQSIVAFTVMKIVDNGMFVFDAKGLHMRFDVLPYEKIVTNVNLKINDFIIRTRENKKIEGEEYLKKALKVIIANPDDFSEYTEPEESETERIIVTDSIVGM